MPDERPRYHHGDLRAALLDATLALLAEAGGPDEVSLRAVARRVGVSPNAAYRHFADKRALLAAVAAAGFREVGAAFRVAAEADGTAEAAVARGLAAYLGFAAARPALYGLMFGRGGAELGRLPELKREADACLDAASALVARLAGGDAGRDGRPGPTVRERTVAFWALAHGYASLRRDLQFADLPAGDVPDERALLRILLGGLSAGG